MPCIYQSAPINFPFFYFTRIRMAIIYVSVYFLSTAFCHLDPAIFHRLVCSMFVAVTSGQHTARGIDGICSTTPSSSLSLVRCAFKGRLPFYLCRDKRHILQRHQIDKSSVGFSAIAFCLLRPFGQWIRSLVFGPLRCRYVRFINCLICFIAFIFLHRTTTMMTMRTIVFASTPVSTIGCRMQNRVEQQ